MRERERESGGDNAGGRAETLHRERERTQSVGGGGRRRGCDEGERKLRRKSKEGRSTVIGRRQITYSRERRWERSAVWREGWRKGVKIGNGNKRRQKTWSTERENNPPV